MVEFEAMERPIVAVTTLFSTDNPSDRLRSNLAILTFNKLKSYNFDTVVIDGGSSPDFLKRIDEVGIKAIAQEGKGLGVSRRQAIKLACDTGKTPIVIMEPEKVDFVSQIEKLSSLISEDRADFVIPKRRSLKTYPVAQQLSEDFGNLFIKELIGFDLDLFFGPRIFKGEMAQYFLNYDGKYGDAWESIFIPVLDAIQDGKRVLSVPIDYFHPKEQREAEEHDLDFFKKRVEMQLLPLIKSMELRWKKS